MASEIFTKKIIQRINLARNRNKHQFFQVGTTNCRLFLANWKNIQTAQRLYNNVAQIDQYASWKAEISLNLRLWCSESMIGGSTLEAMYGTEKKTITFEEIK